MNLGQKNDRMEFKAGLRQLNRGLISLCAMLNSCGGGSVFFGVSDDGEICGVSAGNDTLDKLSKRIRQKIKPGILSEIKLLEADGKAYIKVSAQGSDIPYSFDGRYYVRVQGRDEQAENALLRKMLSSSESDLLCMREAPVQDLSLSKFSALLVSKGLHPDLSQDFYHNYGFLTDSGKFSLNAFLLADNNSVQLNVSIFTGTDRSSLSSRKAYGETCLLFPMMEILNFFESVNDTAVDVTGPVRIEHPCFDYPSFREAWINACAHNDWNSGLSPTVQVFQDRLEVISYGGLPFRLSRDDFFKGRSLPVNRHLLMCFIAAGFAEHSGHGVPTIVARYGTEVFSFAAGQLCVTIPFSHEPLFLRNRRELDAVRQQGSNDYQIVRDLLRDHKKATLNDVAKRSGLSLSAVRRIARVLRERGILKHSGSGRGGSWAVI